MKDFLIIFDLDGTLLNTDLLIFKSFEHVFNKYFPDYTLSKEELLSFLGPSLKDSFNRYAPESQVDELIKCYRDYNHSHHEDYIEIYPHIEETLKILKNKDYPMVVLTTKMKHTAIMGLDIFYLTSYFEEIIGCDTIEKGKPDPEGIYKALSLTSCTKGVMIGDNKSDLLAGKNANIYTIGVKWSPKGYKEMEALHPDLLIDDMKEIITWIDEVNKKC